VESRNRVSTALVQSRIDGDQKAGVLSRRSPGKSESRKGEILKGSIQKKLSPESRKGRVQERWSTVKAVSRKS
jgi:hypothetical protein